MTGSHVRWFPRLCYSAPVNRQSAIDEPVVLGDLLGSDELREVTQLYRGSYGVDMSILDRAGLLVSSAADPEEVRAVLAQADKGTGSTSHVAGARAGMAFVLSPLIYDGQRLATIAVGPYAPPDGPAKAGGPAGAGGPGSGVPDPAVMTRDQVDTLVQHAAGMMEILVHHAYTRYLTSTLHTAAMEESFADLAAKNQRLELAVEHMQELDRLKSSFLATMSHELRTPLTSVIGYAEMLYEGLAGPLNNEQRDYLQTILSKADQLLQLITGLLEASVLESGPVSMQIEPLSLHEIIASVIAGLGPQAQARRLELAPCAPGLPRALGDARRIRQVVRNLVANAIKFTSAGDAIRVEVQVGALYRNADARTGSGLRVVVSDRGIGIPPEKLEHIFEPFFQVDSSSTRRYGGTGLGLTLAKSYIEASGGQIWAESTLGEGSSFTFSLPAVPEELAQFLAREPGT